jgi:hypothetical protein
MTTTGMKKIAEKRREGVRREGEKEQSIKELLI